MVPTTTPTIASDSTTVVIHDSTCMEARSEYLPTTQEPTVPTVGASNVVSALWFYIHLLEKSVNHTYCQLPCWLLNYPHNTKFPSFEVIGIIRQ